MPVGFTFRCSASYPLPEPGAKLSNVPGPWPGGRKTFHRKSGEDRAAFEDKITRDARVSSGRQSVI